jgi:hypothetical protein
LQSDALGLRFDKTLGIARAFTMDEKPKYVGRDLPFVEDPALQAMGARVGALRASIDRGFSMLLAARRRSVVDQQFIMTVGVLYRMMECALSVEFLASKGRHRDAAVLVLTLMELRLDLQYAAQESARASVWLANTEQGFKPWRVTKQIKAVFQEPREHEAELANYRHFSMVKHGNPLGGVASFPVGLSAEGIVVRNDPDDKVDVNICITCLFASGSCLHQAFSAAMSLLPTADAEMDQATVDIDKAMAAVDQTFNAHVQQMVEARVSPPSMRHP